MFSISGCVNEVMSSTGTQRKRKLDIGDLGPEKSKMRYRAYTCNNQCVEDCSIVHNGFAHPRSSFYNSSVFA